MTSQMTDEQANDVLIQMAQKKGYLVSLGDPDDQACAIWGRLAAGMNFPVVLLMPYQNGKARVSFWLAGHGREHDLAMARASRAIATVIDLEIVDTHRATSRIMDAKAAAKLAYKLARLTGFRFPLTDERIDAYIASLSAERHPA